MNRLCPLLLYLLPLCLAGNGCADNHGSHPTNMQVVEDMTARGGLDAFSVVQELDSAGQWSEDSSLPYENDGFLSDGPVDLGSRDLSMGDAAETPLFTDGALDLENTDAGMHAQEDANTMEGQTTDFEMPPPECVVNSARCESLSTFWEGSSAQYPIVLAHGFMGWGRGRWLDYFYDIPETLHEAGFSVFAAVVDPVASSEVRSRQLLAFVDEVRDCLCADKVNIIGHSQGGLDARMLIGPLNRLDAVASITTVASPHLGFQLADDVLANRGLGPSFLDALAVLASRLAHGPAVEEANLRATLGSMSIETRSAYNDMYPDPPSVPIFSFAGFTGLLSNGSPVCARGERPSPSRGDIVEPALLPMFGILGGPRTANDGLLPTDSCVWGRFMGCIAADHFDQIGQVSGLSDRFDFRNFYREHALFLASEGY